MRDTLAVSNKNFNEAEWLRLLYLISDTQVWLDDMEKQLLYQLPVTEKRKLFRKTFYLTAGALTHIIEKHYYKIARHPGSAKFTISIADIVYWVREAFHQPVTEAPATAKQMRMMDTGQLIGYDKHAQPTTWLTVITEDTGEIRTAFPGRYDGVDD